MEISSFALEVLAREFLSEYSFVTWSGTLSDFMAWARQRTPQSFTLPGNAARLTVGDAWHPAAEAAYWRCMLANRNVVAGDFAAAITEMRSLLGPLFAAPPAFNIWNVRPDVG